MWLMDLLDKTLLAIKSFGEGRLNIAMAVHTRAVEVMTHIRGFENFATLGEWGRLCIHSQWTKTDESELSGTIRLHLCQSPLDVLKR